jgi:hypothetical protein
VNKVIDIFCGLFSAIIMGSFIIGWPLYWMCK